MMVPVTVQRVKSICMKYDCVIPPPKKKHTKYIYLSIYRSIYVKLSISIYLLIYLSIYQFILFSRWGL